MDGGMDGSTRAAHPTMDTHHVRVSFARLTVLPHLQAQVRFPEVSKAGPAAAAVFKIINRKSQIDASSSEGSQLAVVHGDVRFENI